MVYEMEYYRRLGVEPSCSKNDLKRAFFKLAMKYHPDKNQEDGHLFKYITQAYEILIDDEKRSLYDRGGEEAIKTTLIPDKNTAPQSDNKMPNFTEEKSFKPQFASFWFDEEKFQKTPMESRYGSKVEEEDKQFKTRSCSYDPYKEHFKYSQHLEDGPDKIQELWITPEDRRAGKRQTVKSSKIILCYFCRGSGNEEQVCYQCYGKGYVDDSDMGFGKSECDICNSTGYTSIPVDRCIKCKGCKFFIESSTLEVNLHSDMNDGDEVRFENEGDQNPGCTEGDLVIRIRLKEANASE